MNTKKIKPSEIIKQSCCGNLLSVEKENLIDMVKNLEDQVVLLENQLNNAIVEINRLKRRR